jgi:hypothetical protein
MLVKCSLHWNAVIYPLDPHVQCRLRSRGWGCDVDVGASSSYLYAWTSRPMFRSASLGRRAFR